MCRVSGFAMGNGRVENYFTFMTDYLFAARSINTDFRFLHIQWVSFLCEITQFIYGVLKRVNVGVVVIHRSILIVMGRGINIQDIPP